MDQIPISAGLYSQTTHQVKVTVFPNFTEVHSSPEEKLYVWIYRVRIENFSSHSLQLLTRYWKIIDQYGHAVEVTGAGVVGRQPILGPKDTYEYESGTHLSTPSGMMMGTYEFRDVESREIYSVTIPAFSLDSPFNHPPMN